MRNIIFVIFYLFISNSAMSQSATDSHATIEAVSRVLEDHKRFENNNISFAESFEEKAQDQVSDIKQKVLNEDVRDNTLFAWGGWDNDINPKKIIFEKAFATFSIEKDEENSQ